jgi:hypothetical protein
MARGRQLALHTEYPDPDEEELAGKIAALLREVAESRFLQGLTYRYPNTKSHAAVRAEFAVDPGLPEELRVGVFREPRRYPAWIRFSSTLPQSLPDMARDLRGIGLKLMGVEGPKLLPSDPQGTNHDFTFITPERFLTATAREFYEFARTGAMHGRQTLATTWKTALFLLGHPAVLANLLRSQIRIPSLLEVPWFSTTPYLFGSRAVKYSLRPWLAPSSRIPANPGNNYLREDLIAKLRAGEAGFDFRIQFQLDPYKQRIENALVAWKEKDTPWHKLASIHIPKQEIDSPEQLLFCEHLSTNPWRCLAEHRPLGSVNRVRRRIYYEGSEYRHRQNAVPVQEPTPGV